jgi:CBS domain-containing protein
MTDPEYVDEELKRLSAPPGTQAPLSSDSFWQPIEKLFSKAALAVDVDDTVGEVMKRMRETEYGAVVVTRGGKLAGLLTERDLICRVVGVIDDYESAKAGDVMQVDPVSLRSSDPIVYVLHNMQAGGYRHLPIVDADDRPVSVVSIKDVARYILGHFPKDVYNVTPEPYRGPRTREGA